MFFKKEKRGMDQGNLTEYEYDLLQNARIIIPGNPPKPWGNMIAVPAAGVVAGGWTQEERYVIISSNGYSINEPTTGEIIERNRDSEITYDNISSNNLRFTLPTSGEIIDIFGVDAGDGIHGTNSGWFVKMIYPWWPRASVMIKNLHVPGVANRAYLDGAYVLDIPRLDGWLKAGFSPSGKFLSVLGSAGAVIFTDVSKE